MAVIRSFHVPEEPEELFQARVRVHIGFEGDGNLMFGRYLEQLLEPVALSRIGVQHRDSCTERLRLIERALIEVEDVISDELISLM